MGVAHYGLLIIAFHEPRPINGMYYGTMKGQEDRGPQPMRILREATREEYAACLRQRVDPPTEAEIQTYAARNLYFYEVSTD